MYSVMVDQGSWDLGENTSEIDRDADRRGDASSENAVDQIGSHLASYCGFENTSIEWFSDKTTGRKAIIERALNRGIPVGVDRLEVARLEIALDRIAQDPAIVFEDERNLIAVFPVASGWFVTHHRTAERSGGVDRAGKDQLTALFPFLMSTLGLLHKNARLEDWTTGLRSALEHSDIATVMLDDRCHVSFANRAAERILAAGDAIRVENRKLACRRLVDTLRIESTVQHISMHGARDSEPIPILAIKRKGRRPLLVACVGVPREGDPAPGSPVAVGYLFDPERDLRDVIGPVCEFYNLTFSEQRLVSGLVAGSTLAEVASQISISEHTARSYLKQIFAKTETNRQVELVQLMLRSATRMIVSNTICAFS